MTPETVQQTHPFSPEYPFEEDTISFMDILLVLAKHLKLIIITPTIFCIITIIYVLFIADPIYVSKTTFMSSGANEQKSQMMGLASQFGIAMPMGGSSPKWSYEQVIKSRNMAKSLLMHSFDTEEYGPQKELLQIVTYGNEKPEYGIGTLIKNGIGAVQSMIEITIAGGMYELELSASEPKLAADLAHAVLEELDKHQREYNDRQTTETREFIDERLVDTKVELEETEEALKDFRENNRNIVSSPALQLEQERLARDVAVLIGVYTTLKQQLETAKIEEVEESNFVVILDTPDIPLLPEKPKKKLMVILTGFLGIGLGMIFAFVREYANNSNEEEKEKIYKVKLLIKKNISDILPKRFK